MELSIVENTEEHHSRTSQHVWQFTLEQFIEAVKGSIVACHVFFMWTHLTQW